LAGPKPIRILGHEHTFFPLLAQLWSLCFKNY